MNMIWIWIDFNGSRVHKNTEIYFTNQMHNAAGAK